VGGREGTVKVGPVVTKSSSEKTIATNQLKEGGRKRGEKKRSPFHWSRQKGGGQAPDSTDLVKEKEGTTRGGLARTGSFRPNQEGKKSKQK